MTRKLTCIICPRGCSITVQSEGSAVAVAGNACPKGRQYAIEECTNPTRTVTSTMRVSNRGNRVVSVKTARPVAKENIFDVMKEIHSISVTAPIEIGQVLIPNIFNTDIVATKTVM